MSLLFSLLGTMTRRSEASPAVFFLVGSKQCRRLQREQWGGLTKIILDKRGTSDWQPTYLPCYLECKPAALANFNMWRRLWWRFFILVWCNYGCCCSCCPPYRSNRRQSNNSGSGNGSGSTITITNTILFCPSRPRKFRAFPRHFFCWNPIVAWHQIRTVSQACLFHGAISITTVICGITTFADPAEKTISLVVYLKCVLSKTIFDRFSALPDTPLRPLLRWPTEFVFATFSNLPNFNLVAIFVQELGGHGHNSNSVVERWAFCCLGRSTTPT